MPGQCRLVACQRLPGRTCRTHITYLPRDSRMPPADRHIQPHACRLQTQPPSTRLAAANRKHGMLARLGVQANSSVEELARSGCLNQKTYREQIQASWQTADGGQSRWLQADRHRAMVRWAATGATRQNQLGRTNSEGSKAAHAFHLGLPRHNVSRFKFSRGLENNNGHSAGQCS